MKNFDTEISIYDPRDRCLDLTGVFSGFVMLSVVLVGLFLV